MKPIRKAKCRYFLSIPRCCRMKPLRTKPDQGVFIMRLVRERAPRWTRCFERGIYSRRFKLMIGDTHRSVFEDMSASVEFIRHRWLQ